MFASVCDQFCNMACASVWASLCACVCVGTPCVWHRACASCERARALLRVLQRMLLCAIRLVQLYVLLRVIRSAGIS